MPSFLLALYTPASLLHLIVKSSKPKVNKFLNILYVNGLYPVPDNLLEIKNFRTDSFRVPTSVVGGRIEKTHVKQCENSNGKHLGPALPPPEPEKGPPPPPAPGALTQMA